MRKFSRLVVLSLLGLLSTAVLGAMTALMAAVSLAATALIVPGTGTPNANIVTNYMEHFVDRYGAPFDPSCTSTNGCTLQGIDYPASFFPLAIFPGWCVPGRCETWNESVEEGVDGLLTALEGTDDDVILFGYSQGGAVVSNTLRRIADNPALLDKVTGVVLIGNAYNPDGGLFTRLGFLPTIPFLDITFGPATPTDTGIPITSIGFEYDPVMYAPLYWGNPLALLNALAAFDNVHGYYLTPNGNGPQDSIAYGYTESELAAFFENTVCPSANCRVDAEGNKYYMIPAKSLPLVNAIMALVPDSLKPFVQPTADLVSPVLKVLIDLGYDWSGDPGQTRYLSILPFSPTTNWVEVGVDLVEAVFEGIENAVGGGSTMIAPAPADDVSPLSARITEMTSVSEDTAEDGDADFVADSSTTEQTAGETAVDPVDTAKVGLEAAKPELEAAKPEREAAMAEREAAREAAQAEREAAQAEREAAQVEREAARDAAKAEREAAKAERETAREAAKDAAESDDNDESGQAAA